MDSEALFLEAIRAAFPDAPGVDLGIGDDAALIRASGTLAITTDMLVEGIDFTPSIPPSFIARKALAANLSDLAAMGASPYAFLLSLGAPEWFTPHFTTFVASLASHATRYRIALAGGDLSSSPQLIISITAIGTLAGGRALMRSGGSPGQRIFLSRPLGASSAGLNLLRNGWMLHPDGAVSEPQDNSGHFSYSQRELAASAIRFHAAPEPEVPLGVALAAIPEVHACIDVSDGLSTDLAHLCRASTCGAVIDYERIPQFPDLDRTGATLGINADRAALHGGEEYALLFTSTLRESDLSTRLGRPVYAIGTLTEGAKIVLRRNGRETILEPEGFDHFAKNRG